MSGATSSGSSAALKARVALAALRDSSTEAELAQLNGVEVRDVQEWRQILIDRAEEVFCRNLPAKQSAQLRLLNSKIEQLRSELELLETALSSAGLVRSEGERRRSP